MTMNPNEITLTLAERGFLLSDYEVFEIAPNDIEVVSALLGIAALLSGEFGELQLKVLLTSLTVTAGSICVLACATRMRKKGLGPLPMFGVVVSILAATTCVTAIWTEAGGELVWKSVWSLWVLAGSTAHVCLLSLATLSPRFAWSDGRTSLRWRRSLTREDQQVVNEDRGTNCREVVLPSLVPTSEHPEGAFEK